MEELEIIQCVAPIISFTVGALTYRCLSTKRRRRFEEIDARTKEFQTRLYASNDATKHYEPKSFDVEKMNVSGQHQ